jgi:TolA-binding protein
MIRRHPDAAALIALALLLPLLDAAGGTAPAFRVTPAVHASAARAEETAARLLERFEQRRGRVWERLDQRMRELEQRLRAMEQRQRVRAAARAES